MHVHLAAFNVDTPVQSSVVCAGATLGECMQASRGLLRRCRYLRSLLIRDEQSWASFKNRAKHMLALSFVFFSRELDFASDLDFEDVSVMAGAPAQGASAGV